MAAVTTSPAFSHPMIVEKLFTLPVVSDVYFYGSSSMEKLLSPVQPYLTKTTSSLNPLVERATVLKAGLEDRLPESISTGLNFVKEKAVAVTTSLDSKLCSGLEQLMEHVPALKESTPVLYTTSLDTAVKHATSASTYVASFTLAQIVLKMSDLGLESADSLLKLVPASYEERCKPMVDGVRKVRAGAAYVRKEGVKANGTEKMASLEAASLPVAVVELFGLGYFLSLVGMRGVEEGEVVEVAE